jgi:hypothetical protein
MPKQQHKPTCFICREVHERRALNYDGRGINSCGMYRSRIATLTQDYQHLGPMLAAAPDLIQERNTLWDALSEILESVPDTLIGKPRHKRALSAIEAAQKADAARGWEESNEPPKGKG